MNLVLSLIQPLWLCITVLFFFYWLLYFSYLIFNPKVKLLQPSRRGRLLSIAKIWLIRATVLLFSNTVFVPATMSFA